MVWLEGFDDEAALCLGGTVGYEVANAAVLKLGQDAIGAGEIRRKKKSIDPLGGVPTALMPSHLCQPWPHLSRLGVDGGCMHRGEHGLVEQTIAGERSSTLARGCARRAAEPLQHAIRGADQKAQAE